MMSIKLLSSTSQDDGTGDASISVRNGNSCFTLWQLPSQGLRQMASYVIRSEHGKVMVIDGGNTEDGCFLKNFLFDLGGHVDSWFITHPHSDHINALIWILYNQGSLVIDNIYASFPPLEWIGKHEPIATNNVNEFNAALKNAGRNYKNVAPNDIFDIDGIHIEILSTENTDITFNAINNSSMMMKVTDKTKSILFLGDLGARAGDKLLGIIDHQKLKADYVQMAHHGQAGVDKKFYQIVMPDYGLWSTPLWLWNNDNGGGHDSGPWLTLKVRQWMEDLKIKSNYVSGLSGVIKI